MDEGINFYKPESYQSRVTNLKARVHIIKAIRSFFDSQGFLEVDTPALQVSPGLEPHLHAFKTTMVGPDGSEHHRMLHTSPEFAMKKLLVAGAGDIYQLAKVFRNNEASYLHHPEFTMLEWYRTGAGYEKIMEDSEAMIRSCYEASRSVLADGASDSTADGTISWMGKSCNVAGEWQRLTVADAFQKFAETDIFSSDLIADCKRLDIHVADDDSWDDRFFRIFLEKIEPNLGVGRPTILYEYPASQSALAKVKADDPRVCERFEIYICGLELANAFHELTDWQEQEKRFEADMQLKEKLYGERYPIDAEFIDALKLGMPASSGIALGVDRLVMLLTGAVDIKEVLWYPVR